MPKKSEDSKTTFSLETTKNPFCSTRNPLKKTKIAQKTFELPFQKMPAVKRMVPKTPKESSMLAKPLISDSSTVERNLLRKQRQTFGYSVLSDMGMHFLNYLSLFSKTQFTLDITSKFGYSALISNLRSSLVKRSLNISFCKPSSKISKTQTGYKDKNSNFLNITFCKCSCKYRKSGTLMREFFKESVTKPKN